MSHVEYFLGNIQNFKEDVHFKYIVYMKPTFSKFWVLHPYAIRRAIWLYVFYVR